MNEIADKNQRFEQARLLHEQLARKGDVQREKGKQMIKELHATYKKPWQPEHVISNFYKEVNDPKEYYHYDPPVTDLYPKTPVDIYVKRNALKNMWQDVMMDPLVEQGGFYYGRYIYDYKQNRWAVAIQEVNPVFDPNAHHSGFRMSTFAKGTDDREKYYLGQKLTRLGFYHSHPKPYRVFFTPEDVDCFANQAGQPYQTALVIATDQKQAGFFLWEEGEVKITDKSYFNFFIENEIQPPISTLTHSYEARIKECSQAFEQFVDVHHQLAPLRPYIPIMIKNVKEAIAKIPTHFADRSMAVSAEKIKTIFKEYGSRAISTVLIFPSEAPMKRPSGSNKSLNLSL